MKGIPVVVTTQHRDVWFGYVDPADAESGASVIRLSNARHVFSWSPETQGVGGLAAKGPQRGSKVGPVVPRVAIRDVVVVMSVADEAAGAWEAARWG